MIILQHSRLLCANVDSTLNPKIEALCKLGFSKTQIVKLVTACPSTLNYLNYCNVRPRIEFLRAFLGSNDRILKAFSHYVSLLSHSFERMIKPKITFLTECQVSDAIIGCIYQALRSICSNTSEQIDAKIKLLGCLGFSEAEISSAIRKQPYILSVFEKNLHDTVEFLVKEAGFDHSYLSGHSNIFTFCLSKRLVPRNHVLQLLKAKGIVKKGLGFYNVSSIYERQFVEKFIFRYEEEMPELHDVYLCASS